MCLFKLLWLACISPYCRTSKMAALQWSLHIKQVLPCRHVSLWSVLHMHTFFPCDERSTLERHGRHANVKLGCGKCFLSTVRKHSVCAYICNVIDDLLQRLTWSGLKRMGRRPRCQRWEWATTSCFLWDLHRFVWLVSLLLFPLLRLCTLQTNLSVLLTWWGT